MVPLYKSLNMLSATHEHGLLQASYQDNAGAMYSFGDRKPQHWS